MRKNEIFINAYGKINLGLDVIRKMENGYHEVCMIMQTVGIYDTVVIRRGKEQGIQIIGDDKRIPCDSTNLAWKAANVLTELYLIRDGMEIEIEKRIPVAAGMAGGSTDCAAVIKGVNSLFSLGLTTEKMCEIGVKLGADVPYCIMGGTVLSEGIGEKLTPLSDAPECILLLAKPDISVSTKSVYENLKIDEIKKHPNISGLRKAIEEQNLKKMCEYMDNVLESVTGKQYPVIGEIEEKMKEAGALHAMMSGSGPTVFGIFSDREEAEAGMEEIKKKKLAKEVFITDFKQPKKGGAYFER